MKVTLNIENDKELRAYIKDCIKGQVLSITREEINELIKEEVQRKLKGLNQYTLDRYIKEGFTQATANILRKEHDVQNWNTSFIEPYVENKLDAVLKNKDWDRLVNDLANQKIKKLINQK